MPQKAIKEMLSNMLVYEENEAARTEFRASSLPYCGLLDYVDRRDQPSSSFDYGGFHYTTIGTAVHETVQRLIYKTNKGKLFGTWRCLSYHKGKVCGKLHYNQLEPTVCECCGQTDRNFFYEELEVAWPPRDFKKMEDAAKKDNVLMSVKRKLCGVNTFTGHVDGVFQAANGKYYVLEYKTTSKDKVDTGRGLPVSYHPYQARRYAGLITKLHGITISGFFLIYLGRDTAAKSVTSMSGKTRLEGVRPFYFATDESVRADEVRKMDMEYKQRRAGTALLKDPKHASAEKFLLKAKPCKSLAEYKSEFFNGYMKKDASGKSVYPCPFANGGKCFKMKSIPKK